MLPRSAYFHVPFCSHRCGYCNFTLISGRDELIPAFIDALAGELEGRLGQPQVVDTIFLGGGTPSHLQPDDLQRLLELITGWLKLSPQGEFSCEVNPLDCTPERLQLLASRGVNRISVGGQSFNDTKLRQLERDHSGEQLQAALAACAAYVRRVSLDLIFGVPDESLATWQADLATALASPIGHLSTYGLTIERGSAFYGRALRRQLHELTPEVQLAMYQQAIATLAGAGWEHYEVSNFALPAERCRHNESYWLGDAWWGFGPGAASFEHAADGASYRRVVNHRSTTTYLNRSRRGQSLIAETDVLTREDYVRERLVFGLRRLQGVDFAELDALWGGAARELFAPYLDRYLQGGLLEETQGTIRLTPNGLVISDSLWPDLLTADAVGGRNA